MFLILGILIVIALISIRVAIEPAKRITRPGEFDSNNIRNEFSNVQKYSSSNRTEIIENINDFTNFMQTRLNERKIDLDVIYVNGFIDSDDSDTVNITIGNYLGSTIENVNVSFGNATGEQGSFLINSLSSGNHETNNITFSVLEEEKHINVTYTLGGSTNTLFYTFTPKSSKDTISTLFDLSITIIDKITNDQFIQTDYR